MSVDKRNAADVLGACEVLWIPPKPPMQGVRVSMATTDKYGPGIAIEYKNTISDVADSRRGNSIYLLEDAACRAAEAILRRFGRWPGK